MAGDRTAYAIGADLTAVDRVKFSVERNSGLSWSCRLERSGSA